MFRKYKIKSYLIRIFSMILLLTAMIAIIAIFGMLQNQKNLNELLNQAIASDTIVKKCRIEANIAARDVREMALARNTDRYEVYKEQITKNMDLIKQDIILFKNTYGEEDGLAVKYEEAFNNWLLIAEDSISLIEQGDKEEAITVILEKCAPALTNLVTIVNEIDQNTEIMKEAAIVKSERFINIAIVFILTFFFIAMLLSLLFAGQTTKNITEAVDRIKKGVQALSKGDLSSRIQYQAENEFGELSNAMDFSFQELSKYITAIDLEMTEFSKGNFTEESSADFLGDFAHIQKAIESFQSKINYTLLEIKSAVTNVSANAEQLSIGMQDLAQGASEQTSSVEELSSTIEHVSKNIDYSAGYAEDVNAVGITAGETVQKSQKEMGHLLTAIKNIADVSQGINDIIKTIDNIASQTNLLALNAAIEAASAGAAGKGFAVVADEIGKLAQESAEAAKNITSLIEHSLENIEQGEAVANSTNNAFAEVAENAERILGMVEKIAVSSKEEAYSVNQISKGVNDISSVIQNNCAISEESAATSEELGKQSIMMRELLEQFQLKE